MADTSIVVEEIIKSGGFIDQIFHPPYGKHEIEIACRLPYDAFDKIFRLPIVVGTAFPSVITHG